MSTKIFWAFVGPSVFMMILFIVLPLASVLKQSFYGKPWATIAVLVAISQPFTLWMRRRFFQNIPADLDKAARVDGGSHFNAFRQVIMPVMWPGVFIAGMFSMETTTDQVSAVSVTATLFLLIMVFQRQIVSGLTAGAVKE